MTGRKRVEDDDRLRRAQFGSWLQHHRIKVGLSQNALGRELEIDAQQVFAYENGRRQVSRHHLVPLIALLSLDVRECCIRYPKADHYFLYEILFGDRLQDPRRRTPRYRRGD